RAEPALGALPWRTAGLLPCGPDMNARTDLRPLTPMSLVVALAFLWGCASTFPESGSQAVDLDVIFVATDMAVVYAMLEAARVGPGGVGCGLGCGGGRSVVAAASRYGARGVGVDLDPERIREARENAARAGATDRVTFLQQDLFSTDVSAATVVALYLSPEI